MSNKPKESAESLYKFFQQLDPSGGEEADDEGIDYASAGVARRGLEACKMLMAIHHIMGVKPAERAAAEGETAGEGSEELKQELSEAKSEIDRMLLQTMELNKQNKSLKEKVAFLQKQVERLYNKREMAQNLDRIENKKLTDLEQIAEAEAANGKPEGDAPETKPAEAKPAEAKPAAAKMAPVAAPAAGPKKTLNKELAEELDIEAAARAPKEEEAGEKGKA